MQRQNQQLQLSDETNKLMMGKMQQQIDALLKKEPASKDE